MEKKVRIKQLNRQDDIKRSWSAAYPSIEFEESLPEGWEKTQANPYSKEHSPSELLPIETDDNENATAKKVE
ncbi:MAG: hypothetical protein HC781_05030 [Leptolyngbyaceae cyanobacterium CSU_1_4]|nr:hypothetical protein [Leptolyngbyaceae cyanobacterium CSU_1_4]